MFSYFQNSCYTDTLLMIIFKSSSSYWMRNIFAIQNPQDYRPLLCGKKTRNIEETINYAERIRQELKNELVLILKNETGVCTRLRILLNECITELKINNMWSIYSPEKIYDLFCDLFPSLRLDIQYSVNDTFAIGKVSFLTMWEFMDVESNVLWDNLMNETLIFLNTGIPAIRYYNKTGQEETEVVLGPDKKISSTVVKGRAFDEIILDKYVLIGVIILTGYTLGTEGGEHYVCYYRKGNGEWNYYDDITLTDRPIDNLQNRSAFEYNDRNLPYMYFYQNLNTFKNDIQIKIKENINNKNRSIYTLAMESPRLPFIQLPKSEPKILPRPSSISMPPFAISGPTSSQLPNFPVVFPELPKKTSGQQPSMNLPVPQQVSMNLPVPQQPSMNLPVPQQVSMNLPISQQPSMNLPVPQQVSMNLPVPQQPSMSLPVPQQVPMSLPVPQQVSMNLPVPQFSSLSPGPSIALNMPRLPQLSQMQTISRDQPFLPGNIGIPMSFVPMVQTTTQVPSILPVKRVTENIKTKSLPSIPSSSGLPPPSLGQPKERIKGIIDLPEGKTIIENVPITIPKVISTEVYGSLAYTHDIELSKQVILDEIIANEHMLSNSRPSVRNKVYSLNDYKNFARQLGINVNQSKKELLDEIQSLVNIRKKQLNR